MNEENKYTKILNELAPAIQNVFPESGMIIKMNKSFGYAEPNPYFQFTLGKNTVEYSNGIIQNDPMFFSIDIEYVVGGKYKVVSRSAQKIYRKPNTELSEEKYLATGRIKTGWRDFSSYSEDQVIDKLVKFFQKCKNLLRENKAQLQGDTIKLCEQKGYFK